MPGTTTSKLYFVYVLQGTPKKERYIGYTTDLKKRIKEHMLGKTYSTKSILPVTLIYVEGCTNAVDARRREGYLKQTGGRRFLTKRLKEYNSQLS